jgi:hypothetical protein
MQRALIMYLSPRRLSAAVTPACTLTSHVGSFLNGSSHFVLLLCGVFVVAAMRWCKVLANLLLYACTDDHQRICTALFTEQRA